MAKRTSDESVAKATGKKWSEWFEILDKAGAKAMPHRDIADFVYSRYLGKKKKNSTNVSTSNGWWSQMVTVEYERERGLRAVNQNATGFLVSVHKTLDVPVPILIKKWEKILNSKTVTHKKLTRLPSKTKRIMFRYAALEGGVVVSFEKRGRGKSRMVVEAIRLPNAKAVERERKFWKSILAKI